MDNGKTRTHSTIDNSTCAIVVRSVVNIQDSCQCRLCSHPASSRPGPAYRYAPSGLPFPPLRGGPIPLVKSRTATPVRRPGRHPRRETSHYRTAESCHRDRLQQHLRGQVALTGAEVGPSWRERGWPHPPTAENRNVLDGISSHTCKHNRVGGKRSSFLPTFVFRPLTPPYVRFRIRRFFILRAI